MYYLEKLIKWGPHCKGTSMDCTNWLNTPRSGVLLAVASSFLISVCSVLVKVTQIPIGQIIFTTSLVLFIVSVILALKSHEPLFPYDELRILWGRTLFSLPIVIFNYSAVRLLPLSDEALIAYTSIIFTIILGRIFLGENFTKGKLAASAGIFIGVFLVTVGPAPMEHSYLVGCIFSLLGAICDAVCYILLKQLVHLHYSVILFNYSLCSLLLTAPFYLWETWTWEEPLSLFSIAFIATIQELCVTLSLTTEQAGLVCMLHASDVLFSYGWELTLFNEIYTVEKICGALIVTLSVIFSAYLPADEGSILSVNSENDEETALCESEEFV